MRVKFKLLILLVVTGLLGVACLKGSDGLGPDGENPLHEPKANEGEYQDTVLSGLSSSDASLNFEHVSEFLRKKYLDIVKNTVKDTVAIAEIETLIDDLSDIADKLHQNGKTDIELASYDKKRVALIKRVKEALGGLTEEVYSKFNDDAASALVAAKSEVESRRNNLAPFTAADNILETLKVANITENYLYYAIDAFIKTVFIKEIDTLKAANVTINDFEDKEYNLVQSLTGIKADLKSSGTVTAGQKDAYNTAISEIATVVNNGLNNKLKGADKTKLVTNLNSKYLAIRNAIVALVNATKVMETDVSDLEALKTNATTPDLTRELVVKAKNILSAKIGQAGIDIGTAKNVALDVEVFEQKVTDAKAAIKAAYKVAAEVAKTGAEAASKGAVKEKDKAQAAHAAVVSNVDAKVNTGAVFDPNVNQLEVTTAKAAAAEAKKFYEKAFEFFNAVKGFKSGDTLEGDAHALELEAENFAKAARLAADGSADLISPYAAGDTAKIQSAEKWAYLTSQAYTDAISGDINALVDLAKRAVTEALTKAEAAEIEAKGFGSTKIVNKLDKAALINQAIRNAVAEIDAATLQIKDANKAIAFAKSKGATDAKLPAVDFADKVTNAESKLSNAHIAFKSNVKAVADAFAAIAFDAKETANVSKGLAEDPSNTVAIAGHAVTEAEKAVADIKKVKASFADYMAPSSTGEYVNPVSPLHSAYEALRLKEQEASGYLTAAESDVVAAKSAANAKIAKAGSGGKTGGSVKNIKDVAGMEALFLSVDDFANNKKLIPILGKEIKNNINLVDSDGNTLLHKVISARTAVFSATATRSAEDSNCEKIRGNLALLIDSGADPEIENKGETAISIATQKLNETPAKISARIVEVLKYHEPQSHAKNQLMQELIKIQQALLVMRDTWALPNIEAVKVDQVAALEALKFARNSNQKVVNDLVAHWKVKKVTGLVDIFDKPIADYINKRDDEVPLVIFVKRLTERIR